ncbi:MAG TPA: hypothetical protein VKP00_02120, partial [Gemmatimonadaceae bacterium]|nr:hypothetical protein [Gemmatimonadaceae bacterium]
MVTSSSARRLVLALIILSGCREGRISGTEIPDKSGFPKAVRLEFSGQPENGLAWLPIVGAVVTAYDSAGNIAFSFNGPITIGLGDGVGGATASGTITVNAVDGIASFTAVRISGEGRAFTLRAVADGLVLATSDTLNIASLGERVAFISDRDGPQGLYVANADGSGIARLTSDTSSYSEPAWSPDGARIAVVKGGDGIWLMDADGTHARQLAHDGFAPAWTADGTRIRFAKPTGRDGAQTEIDEASATGPDVARIAVWPLDFRAPAKLPPSGPYSRELRWSPDMGR